MHQYKCLKDIILEFHPLPESYKDILESKSCFDLTIVGKDPYPTSPVGIPFCKESWGEFLMDNCSGYHVLLSLGVNLVAAQDNYSTPNTLFEKLAIEGIAFLNASYHLLNSEKILKKHLCYIETAIPANKPIIEKSNACILCGQAKIINSYIPGQANIFEVIHPDVQNRKYKKEEWDGIWLPNILKNIFDLKLEI